MNRQEERNRQEEKCVMVMDESLPLGIVANTAAILGITLGKELPQMVGRDVTDKNGASHPGIITIPVPILKAPAGALDELRHRLYQPGFSDIRTVDFSDLAQSCRTYGEYEDKIAAASEEELHYLGLALCGPKKKVNTLTGSMPLLR